MKDLDFKPEKLNEFLARPHYERTLNQILSSLEKLEAYFTMDCEGYKKLNIIGVQNLALLAGLFNKEFLEKRLKAEFQNIASLDDFAPREYFDGKIFHAPLGHLVHITAGNVFLGMVDSFIMGTITKNKNIIKVGRSNLAAALILTRGIEEIAPELLETNLFINWRGGDAEVEQQIFPKADGVLAWGGEAMTEALHEKIGPKTKLIVHGPKISVQIITKKAWDSLESANILRDITLYHQQACANAQNIFLEQGIDPKEFNLKVKESLTYARPELDDNEYVELLKEKELNNFNEYQGSPEGIVNKNFSLHYSSHPYPETTALNGSVKVKFFQSLSDLADVLKPFSYYLQTCGLGADNSEWGVYRKTLALSGLDRITRVGKMLDGLEGSPHDGEFSLVSLTRIVSDESLIPVTSGISYIDNESIKFFEQRGGYLYSSGGTTGNPKYSFYHYYEFSTIARCLGESYKSQGLITGTKVANLFVAGNLWSSFNAIQEALKYCKAIQFPLGGMVKPEYFSMIAKKFEIKTVFGLPSLLGDLSDQTNELEIDSIYFAGEALSKSLQKRLQKNWKVRNFKSAGYATVDVGPIGYQDPDGLVGDHILFDRIVELKVKDGQAIVTSKLREAMHIQDYPAGDLVELLPPHGDGKTRFRLKGRVDKKIFIWSARLGLDDIQQVLNQLNYQEQFQIQLKANTTGEVFTLVTESALDQEQFLELFSALEDLGQTHSVEYISKHLEFSTGSFLRNERTGKLAKVLDFR